MITLNPKISTNSGCFDSDKEGKNERRLIMDNIELRRTIKVLIRRTGSVIWTKSLLMNRGNAAWFF